MSEPPTVHCMPDLDRQAVPPTSGPGSEPQSRDLLRILVLIAALGIAVFGCLAGNLGLLLSWLQQDSGSLSMATLSISLLLLTVGLGLVLAWQAWSVIRGRPSPAFRPRKVGFPVLLFVLSLIFGQIILSQNLLPLLTFPLLHAAAIILPALVILALVGRGLGEITSRRDMVFQVASGAFLGAPLAFALEAFALLSLLGATLAGLAARPGGQELLSFWFTYLQDPAHLQDLSLLAPLFGSPAIVAAAILFVAGVVPLIEEGVKTMGVGLMAYHKPTLSQAFLWGLAGGAGFAIAEGLLNTTGGFSAWAPLILVRVGATLLHCTTGALMGIAWYSALVKRRWPHALGLYAACVAVHGLWNALSTGMAFLSLGQLGSDPTAGSPELAGLGIIIMIGLIATLALAMAVALVGLTLHLRKRSRASQSPVSRPPMPALEMVVLQDPPAASGHVGE